MEFERKPRGRPSTATPSALTDQLPLSEHAPRPSVRVPLTRRHAPDDATLSTVWSPLTRNCCRGMSAA